MAEYIDREEYCEKHCPHSNEDCDKLSCPIRKAPAADVAPVRHGRWQYNTDFYVWRCSECGENPTKGTGVVTTAEKLPSYCPRCGAKMDGAE